MIIIIVQDMNFDLEGEDLDDIDTQVSLVTHPLC